MEGGGNMKKMSKGVQALVIRNLDKTLADLAAQPKTKSLTRYISAVQAERARALRGEW